MRSAGFEPAIPAIEETADLRLRRHDYREAAFSTGLFREVESQGLRVESGDRKILIRNGCRSMGYALRRNRVRCLQSVP
jgi:hypothetical protein